MVIATAAITWHVDAPFQLEEIVLDQPRADEVLVRMAAASMCNTDISARRGHIPFPLPAVFGHEGSGVVELVGSAVTTVQPGDHVVISFDSCGACMACWMGRPVKCARWLDLNLTGGSRLDGSATMRSSARRANRPVHGHFFGQSSFATHALTSARSVVRVPRQANLEMLGPLACGVQTGVGSILNVLRPEPGSTVAIFGSGSVGLSALLGARLTAASQTIVIDTVPSRIALASELGATHVIDARTDDPVAAVMDFTHGIGAERTLEASGVPSVLRQAVTALAVDGICGVVGAAPFGTEVSLDMPAMLTRNPHIIGINQGDSVPQQFIPTLLDLYLQERLPFDRLVTTFPFTKIEEAAELASHGSVVKPVLLMPDPV